jgi:primosomal protein N' (replication factor Y) (superfamily II helicase)
MTYADVCVNTPLAGYRLPKLTEPQASFGPRFTYLVPERLEGRLQRGHLVWVPFRGRKVQGVVLTLSDQAPEFDCLPIHGLVWSDPVVTSVQLRFAEWLSSSFLTPLIEPLRLMLPVGITQRGKTVLVRTTSSEPEDLSARQALLLERIEQMEAPWDEVSQGVTGATQKRDLAPLIERGLVTREIAYASAPPRAKTERQIRLLADEAALSAALPSLGRASKSADLLLHLAATPEGESSVEALRSAGFSLTTLKSAQAEGWIAVRPAVTLYRATPPSDDPPNLRTASADLLTCIRALPDSWLPELELEELGLNAAARQLAVRKLWLERVTHAASVVLTAAKAELPSLVMHLRGAERHLAAVNYLRSQTEPVSVAQVKEACGASQAVLDELAETGLIEISREQVWRDPLAGRDYATDEPPALTCEQITALEPVLQAVTTAHEARQEGLPDGSARRGFLLFGVTGSGKTEIYLRAIAETLALGHQAVVLVPEIALTPQTIRRFAARFPGQVTVWHSQLSPGERFDVWRRICHGDPAAQVVVGSRSAILLPFPSLGLIVVDEEHESTYKEARQPHYHARDAALTLGALANAVVLLGSATPALETYHAAQTGNLTLLTLQHRVIGHRQTGSYSSAETFGDLPDVRVVDMRQELRAGNRSIFSRSLQTALARVLLSRQQAILYLNRRGTNTFVMCRDCGYVAICERCSSPLTYHGSAVTLRCGHCGAEHPIPVLCPKCESTRIRYFGSGTERVEETVKTLLPGVRTLRWDRDVTGTKGAHEAILNKFMAHEADVLVGTQMIAKGLDLPLVTLVGIVAADTGLFLPDFRAAERTFQLLTQVAGRAGRSELGGSVVVQSYRPDHYAIVAASHHDYGEFYRQEMIFRREQGYPPVRRLARILFQAATQPTAAKAAKTYADALRDSLKEAPLPDTDLIGPAPCYFLQQRDTYRWHVLVRSPNPIGLLVRVPPPLGSRLDVDPTDVL